jgi:peptidase M1, membrane alanine aminopeptidase
MNYKQMLSLMTLGTAGILQAQNTPYWQQHVDYKMDIDMNVKNYQYTGKQELTYTNNSPDTLKVVFYHLFLNAFQPGSEMDARLQTIKDPDHRMVNNLGTKENPQYQSRISQFKPEEIGFLRVNSLSQDGVPVKYKTESTILKVDLNKPIPPHSSTVLKMDFVGQAPVMIRRTGRNNPDGVALSMSQWYPKLAEYDFRGWNTTEYITREFYGVWGNFDVKITLDKNYIVGGSGYLQNNNEIGFGYEDAGVKVPKVKGNTRTWHFYAPQVHDFTWAADPEFIHDKLDAGNGQTLHFLYKKYPENWKKIQPDMLKAFQFYNKFVGKYPWRQYSFIQGGDGGMEYAMCTLIQGEEKFERLQSTAVHELGHAWFHLILASDETAYPWLDEGFCSYIQDRALEMLGAKVPFAGFYKSYDRYVKSKYEETPTHQSDRFDTNYAYSITSYSKGALFLRQLEYIIGEKNVEKTLQLYYKKFAFKHPQPNDLIRCAEKVSGMQLQWYLNEFMQTPHHVDYAVDKVEGKGNKTSITLRRVDRLPLPSDVFVVDKNNKTHYFYIPLRMQFGEKENPYSYERKVLPSWGWGHPTYTFEVDIPFENIQKVVIDPENITTDINRDNNTFQK